MYKISSHEYTAYFQYRFHHGLPSRYFHKDLSQQRQRHQEKILKSRDSGKKIDRVGYDTYTRESYTRLTKGEDTSQLPSRFNPTLFLSYLTDITILKLSMIYYPFDDKRYKNQFLISTYVFTHMCVDVFFISVYIPSRDFITFTCAVHTFS